MTSISWKVMGQTCPGPTNLIISTITPTSSMLDWTENGSATNWQIEWGTSGFTPGSGNFVLTSTNPHLLMGLAGSTTYQVYVRAICGVADSSIWHGPWSFTTPCPAVITPFFDDVESHTATTNFTSSNCWMGVDTSSYDWNIDGSGSTPSSGTGPIGAFSGSNYFYTEASGSATGETTSLFSPFIDVSGLTTPQLSFYYHMHASTGNTAQMGNLYIEVFNGSSWTIVDSIKGTQQFNQTDPWQKKHINLSSFSGTIQIQFRAVSNGSYRGDISLDDISVEEQPSCLDPTILTATNITGYTADLGWVENGTATNWEIEWGNSGFTQGTGTFVTTSTNPHTLTGLTPTTNYDFYVRAICGAGDTSTWSTVRNFMTTVSCPAPSNLIVSNVTATTANVGWIENGTATNWEIEWGTSGFTKGTGTFVTTSTNPHTLIGLTPTTNYDFYVRAICGAGDTSVWFGIYSFTSACPTSTAPFFDDIETHLPTTSLNTSNCWNSIATTNYDWNIDGSGSTPSSQTGPLGAFSGNNFFYIEASSTSGGEAASLFSPFIDISGLSSPQLSFYYHMYGDTSQMGDLYIEIFDGSSWTIVDSIIGTQQFAQADPWLEKLIDLSNFSGAIQVQFKAIGNGSYQGDISLDDISIRETPACTSPTALTATNITITTAHIAWTENGTATNWQIEWDSAGFVQGTGTSIMSTTNSDSISGLNGGSVYEFYVRSICSIGDTSGWSGPIRFTTLCPPSFGLPWSEGFENGGAIPNCWTMGGGEPWLFTTSGPDHVGYNGTITGSTVTNSYYAVVDATGDDGPTTLTSPFIDISSLTTPQLVFYEISDNEGNASSRLDVAVWDGVAWNNVATYNTNTNGWLRREIDLSTLTFTGPAAVQFTFSEVQSPNAFWDDIAIDDVTFIETPLNDLGVISITNSNSGCSLTSSETIEVEVYNFATLAQSSYDMIYAINGTPITPESVSTTINPGDTMVYTFTTPADLSAVGPHVITAYVNLIADLDGSNDSSTTTITNMIKPTDPITTGDYACGVPGSYTVSATGDNISWYDNNGSQIGQGNSFTTSTITSTTSYYAESTALLGGQLFTTHFNAGDGCTNGNMFDLVATSNFTIDSFAINPFITAPMMPIEIYYIPNPMAGFQASPQVWTLLGQDTLLNVSAGVPVVVNIGGISMSTGNTFAIYINAPLSYTNGNSTYTNGDMTITKSSGICTPWIVNSSNHIVNREWNGTIYYTKDIGCVSNRIKATVDFGCLSINDQLDNSIDIYPNPTNNILNIEFESLEGNNSVQLLSVTGEILRSINIHSTLTTMDISEFSKGLYTLKITSGDTVKFKKILIE